MKDLTLVIMAAGMGSRFGGLKQVEKMGPNNEFLIDYSIYDAINAGFNKVVFIIKRENLEIFQETVVKRIEKNIKVEYAFQDLEEAKEVYGLPSSRIKPLGTTHAILCAKKVVDTPFLVINADDFYGKEAFIDAINFLKETNYQKNGIVLYQIVKTLTENGAVKRGICQIENNKLIDAIECNVLEENNKIIASPLNNLPSFEINKNHPVSMNMFILMPEIFSLLENVLKDNIKKNKDNLDKYEALIIEDLFILIKQNKLELNTVITNSKWFGVTYREDKDKVIASINKMVENKEYPNNLWQ